MRMPGRFFCHTVQMDRPKKDNKKRPIGEGVPSGLFLDYIRLLCFASCLLYVQKGGVSRVIQKFNFSRSWKHFHPHSRQNAPADLKSRGDKKTAAQSRTGTHCRPFSFYRLINSHISCTALSPIHPSGVPPILSSWYVYSSIFRVRQGDTMLR